jgi:hypothetical protein
MYDKIWTFVVGLGLLVNAINNVLLLRRNNQLRRRVQTVEKMTLRLLREKGRRHD